MHAQREGGQVVQSNLREAVTVAEFGTGMDMWVVHKCTIRPASRGAFAKKDDQGSRPAIRADG